MNVPIKSFYMKFTTIIYLFNKTTKVKFKH